LLIILLEKDAGDTVFL